MSEEFILKTEERKKIGKEEALRLRDDKMLPVIVYGAGVESPVPLSVNYVEFEKLFNKVGKHHLITIEVGGKKVKVIIKDYKFHPITRRFQHADLLAITEGKPFITEVPVNYTGTPVGVKEGGSMLIFTKKLKIRTTQKDLPSSVEIDISHLQQKQYMIVREILGKFKFQVLTNEGNVLIEIKA
ncbi:MAG: 50S ribosomal protein L25 [Brevinematales bacterium]|nr:50S ribosomal protein L25 [Brevinematales bacterium]